MKVIKVNNNDYTLVKLLGHGKGGYSYLGEKQGKQYVIKRMHHEPCSYYEFSNKLEMELKSYERLFKLIPNNIPHLVEFDKDQEIIVKDYIEGKSIDKYVLDELMEEDFYSQIKKMEEICKKEGFNLDYFPTNFIVNNHQLYYVDYELNEYMDKWNYDNWGSKYWSRTDEFINFFLNTSSEIITERLVLRNLNIEDIEHLLNNHQMVENKINFSFLDLSNDVDHIKQYLEQSIKDFDDNNKMKWAIVLSESRETIGIIEVSHRDMNEVSKISYILLEKYWNQGLMGEALDAVTNKIFERGINVIGIDSEEGDVASNMIAIKNGFTLVDTTKEMGKDYSDNFVTVNHYIKRKE